ASVVVDDVVEPDGVVRVEIVEDAAGSPADDATCASVQPRGCLLERGEAVGDHLRRGSPGNGIPQEQLEIRWDSEAVHSSPLASDVEDRDACAFRDELVVDRRDVELAVDAQVLRDHLRRGAYEIAAATEVIDAHGGFVGDGLFLDDTRHEPTIVEADERP